MAAGIGPNHYVTGQVLRCPYGQACDKHEERLAEVRVVGETDSFGSELVDMCQECFQDYLRDKRDAQDELVRCQLCGSVTDTCKAWRDPEEGISGRHYMACQTCRHERERAFAEALSDAGEDDDDSAEFEEAILAIELNDEDDD